MSKSENTTVKTKTPKTTFVQGENYIEGTVTDIIGKGEKSRLRINGVPVSQPALSALASLGIVEKVGVAERPEGVRGPKPTIVRLYTDRPNMTVTRR